MGIFYTCFAEQNILTALRQNGIIEQEYIVTDPNFYCGPLTSLGTTLASTTGLAGTTCPTPSQLQAQGTTSVPTIYQISPNFHAPYLMQTSLSLERQLTKSVQVSLTYNNAQSGDDQHCWKHSVNALVLPGTRDPYARLFVHRTTTTAGSLRRVPQWNRRKHLSV